MYSVQDRFISTSAWISCFLVAFGVGAESAVAKEPHAKSARLNIDHVLRLESVDGAEISPDGRSIAIVKSSAIGARSRAIYFPPSANDTRLYLASSSDSHPHEIQPPASLAVSLFHGRESWSPDSKWLVVRAALSTGKISSVLVDSATGSTHVLPGETPFGSAVFEWLADNRLIYATSAGRWFGPLRGDAFEKPIERWRDTWRGSSSQATVSSASPFVEPSAVPSGSLMMAHARTGETSKLVDGDFIALSASPDGNRLASVCLPTSPRTRVDRGVSRDHNNSGGELCVFTVERDTLTLNYRSRGLIVPPHNNLVWSPAGDQLLLSARPEADDVYSAGIYLYDVAGSDLRRVRPPSDVSIHDYSLGSFAVGVQQFGWIDGTPVVVARAKAAQSGVGASSLELKFSTRYSYAVESSERYGVVALGGTKPGSLISFATSSVERFLPLASGGALVAADGRLWRISIDKPPEQLSRDDSPSVVAVKSVFPSSDRLQHRLARIDVAANGRLVERIFDISSRTLLRPDATPPAASTIAVASDSNERLVEIREQHDAATYLLVRDRQLTPIFSINRFLRQVKPGVREPFPYVVDGQQRTGWLVRPPDFRAGTRHPAVLLVYGGVTYGEQSPPGCTDLDNRSSFTNGQLLASNGFVVICPSLPLSAGASEDLPAEIARSAVAALDAVGQRGLIDMERVGVMGTSFGGYSTLAILAKAPGRFRAGIVESPLVDPIASWGASSVVDGLAITPAGAPVETFTSTGFPEGGQLHLLRPFWENPQAYVRNSPLFQAPNILAPVMIMQGDLDGRNFFNSAQRLYAALIRVGNPAVFVRYWGEGHSIQTPANMRDQAALVSAWLNAHLHPPSGGEQ